MDSTLRLSREEGLVEGKGSDWMDGSQWEDWIEGTPIGEEDIITGNFSFGVKVEGVGHDPLFAAGIYVFSKQADSPTVDDPCTPFGQPRATPMQFNISIPPMPTTSNNLVPKPEDPGCVTLS